MKLSLRVRSGAARWWRGAGAFFARVRAWVWTALLVKALAVGAGLVVLALIGGSARAGGGASPAPSIAAAPSVDPPVLPPAPDPAAWVDAQAHAAPAPAPALEETPPAADRAPRSRATPDDPVILNQATSDDLRRLPGIGAKRAQSILTVRGRMGRFRQVEDLLKVKGIGRAMLRRLRPLVRLDPPAAAEAR